MLSCFSGGWRDGIRGHHGPHLSYQVPAFLSPGSLTRPTEEILFFLASLMLRGERRGEGRDGVCLFGVHNLDATRPLFLYSNLSGAKKFFVHLRSLPPRLRVDREEGGGAHVLLALAQRTHPFGEGSFVLTLDRAIAAICRHLGTRSMLFSAWFHHLHMATARRGATLVPYFSSGSRVALPSSVPLLPNNLWRASNHRNRAAKAARCG